VAVADLILVTPMHRAMLISLLFPIAVFAAASEHWPGSLRDLPFDVPTKLTYRGFTIEVERPSDPSVRAGGGSGGPMLTFRVRTPSGRVESFDEQSIGVRLLEFYHGYPQLEIWGRAGGERYTRELHRLVRGAYHCVALEEFTRDKSTASKPSLSTTLPGGTDRVYFVESRPPDDE
jgi:hypothetical protein